MCIKRWESSENTAAELSGNISTWLAAAASLAEPIPPSQFGSNMNSHYASTHMRVHVVFFIIGWGNTRLRAHICLPSKSCWEHRPVSKRCWWLHGGLDVMWTVVMFLVISFKSYWIQHPSIDPLSSTYPKQQAKEDIHDALLPSSAEQSLVAPKAWSPKQVLGLLQSLLPIVVCSRNLNWLLPT